MKIHVNLLSQQAQNRIHRVRLVHLLRWVLLIILFTDAGITGILETGNLLLDREVARLERVSEENQRLYDELKHDSFGKELSVEKEIATIAQLQKNYILWTEVLLPITKEQNSEIQLQNMHFTQTTRAFSIAGKANSRNALIEYRNQLLSNDLIETIDAPLSSFTQKENVSFEFQGTFQPVTLP